MPKPEIHRELDEILEIVRRGGRDVKKRQYRRWRRWRLVPGPSAQRGLGRGTRKYAYYPPRTVKQVIALDRALNQKRSLADAGWSLWVQGFPVTEFVQQRLHEEIEEIVETVMEGLRKWEEEDPDNPITYAKEARRLPGAGQARKRLGRDGITTPAWVLFATLAGKFEADNLETSEVPDMVGQAVEAELSARGAGGILKVLRQGDGLLPLLTELTERWNLPRLQGEIDVMDGPDLRELSDRAQLIFSQWKPKRSVDEFLPISLVAVVFLFDQLDLCLGEFVAALFIAPDPTYHRLGELVQFLTLTGKFPEPN